MLLVFILECSTHLCCTILFLSTFQFKAFLINIPMVAYHINVMAKHDTEPRVKVGQRFTVDFDIFATIKMFL